MKSSPDPDQPLAGLTILVTRPAAKADALAEQLVQLGGEVVFHPVIDILPPSDWGEVDRAIEKLDSYGTVAFVSRNGVEHFLGRLRELRRFESISMLDVISIGAGTSAALADHDISATTIAGKSDSDSVADQLVAGSAKQPILLVRANRGSSVLPDRLTEAQLEFDQVVAYYSVDRATADADVIEALAAGEIDWVTATSSAIGRSVVRLFGQRLSKTRLVSISPTTSSALRACGCQPAAEAKTYDMSGVVAAIVKHATNQNS